MTFPKPRYPSRNQTEIGLPHLPELDGIRGMAALAVFCHHLMFASIPFPETGGFLLLVVYRVSQFGAFGVDLFFVLSGFLITSIILLDRRKPHFFWNFYWKRTLRIFPLYIVSLVCLAALVPPARPYVFFSALFIANFAPAFHVVADGPFWTLAIEEQFYLVWPRLGYRLSVVRLQRVALAIVVACLALRLGAAAVGHHAFRYTFFHCDGLALGAVLACERSRQVTGAVQQPALRYVKQSLLIVSALGISLLPFLLNLTGRRLMVAEAGQILAVSTLSYIIVRVVVNYTGSSALRLLRSPVLTFFGLISYCFYMSHLYVLQVYDSRYGVPRLDAPGKLLLRFFVILTITVAVCVLSRYLIELPSMKLRRFVLRRS